jgi:hypothetical protein
VAATQGRGRASLFYWLSLTGRTKMELSCKRCGVVVLKGAKGVAVQEEGELQMDGENAGSERITQWISVKNMFDFENVAFSRQHKNLAGGLRLLTCAGCEKGILGKAMPVGEGPDIKMESLVAPGRLNSK